MIVESVAEFDDDINMHRSNSWTGIYPAGNAIFSSCSLLDAYNKFLNLGSKVKFRDVERTPRFPYFTPGYPDFSECLIFPLQEITKN